MGDLLGAIEEHDIEPLIHSGAGQSVGYFDKVQSVAEIMQDLLDETVATLESQQGFLK